MFKFVNVWHESLIKSLNFKSVKLRKIYQAVKIDRFLVFSQIKQYRSLI